MNPLVLLHRLVTLIMLAWALSGCAETVRQASEAATPAVVEGSVEGVSEPETRRQLAQALSDPEVQRATADLTQAMTEGVLAGLASDVERAEYVQAATEQFVQRIGVSLAKTLRSDIGPEVAAIVAESVDRSLERAFDAESQERMRGMTQAVAQSTVEALVQAMNTPAGEPGGGLSEGMGKLVRHASRQGALGFQDAVRISETARERGREGEGSVLSAAGQSADVWTGMLPWLPIGAGLLLVGLVVALVWAMRRAGQRTREAREHEQTALALAQAIRSAEDAPWSPELRNYIERAAVDPSAAERLRRLIGHQTGNGRHRQTPPEAPA